MEALKPCIADWTAKVVDPTFEAQRSFVHEVAGCKGELCNAMGDLGITVTSLLQLAPHWLKSPSSRDDWFRAVSNLHVQLDKTGYCVEVWDGSFGPVSYLRGGGWSPPTIRAGC
jgi:hypothetical protein